MSTDNRRVAIVIPSFDVGGVERMMINLALGLTHHGVAVDVVVDNEAPPYLGEVAHTLRIVALAHRRGACTRERLEHYLADERPAAALASKTDASLLLLESRRAADVPVRIVIRIATNLSGSLSRHNPIKRWLTYRATRAICREADAIVAVSQGVAENLASITGLPPNRIDVIPNPVITPELYRLAAAPVAHPWLAEKRHPVIISVGRLSRAKDFPLLIHAFARLRRRRPCRLVILGDGRQRSRIKSVVAKLGVGDSVDLPGFVVNPYACIARADLFVLSSRWEGSPNALTEAMALGIPVVATDCPSGPREILQNGRYGRLVPVGDAEAMTEAMAETLAAPAEAAILRQAVQDYKVEGSAQRYLDILLPR